MKGFVTAGNSDIRDVCAAAWPRTTKVSREIIWLSRIPAPSKPAASMSRRSAISSGIGAVPGTRRWTRTGSVMSVTSLRGGRDCHEAPHEAARIGNEAGGRHRGARSAASSRPSASASRSYWPRSL